MLLNHSPPTLLNWPQHHNQQHFKFWPAPNHTSIPWPSSSCLLIQLPTDQSVDDPRDTNSNCSNFNHQEQTSIQLQHHAHTHCNTCSFCSYISYLSPCSILQLFTAIPNIHLQIHPNSATTPNVHFIPLLPISTQFIHMNPNFNYSIHPSRQ